MNLIRAELSRLAARRFVQLMVVLLVAAFAVTIATTLASSHRPSPDELARAQQQVEQQRFNAEQWHRECLAAQEPGAPAELREKFPSDCVNYSPSQPRLENFLAGVFVFEREIRPLMFFLTAFLALFGFLVGASSIGAELTSGGMTNLLLWRPQRMTVLGTKLGTLLASALVLSVVATVLYVGAFWVIAEVGGLPGNVDARFWGQLSLTAARGLALTLGAAALGFAIATLGRHTAAALGVVAAYAIVWEVGARIVMEVVEAVRPEQWMLSTYLGAWMAGRIDLWDRSGCGGDVAGFCDPRYTVTWVYALVVLLGVLAAFVGAAFYAFRRRDLA